MVQQRSARRCRWLRVESIHDNCIQVNRSLASLDLGRTKLAAGIEALKVNVCCRERASQ